MSFYGNMAATAAGLITKFGAAASLARITAGAYNPVTGTSTPTEVVQAVRAVVLDYDAKMIDGSMIQQGDKQVYLSAVGVLPPAVADVLTWQGVAYTIISVKPLAPAGVDTLHELQVRK
ncbi:hypothetical protein QTI05_22745 [Variovorax sp. J22R193]|uniref:hypothetical protein n=1 Tax=Variovorax fucosicus TaxID=3053517 RepID=UPI00257853C4|nr:hypothetical protein [Variovorax sp. J22R193]MDM0041877.1 hypothetical protein [Variovorax sp. J22R193]